MQQYFAKNKNLELEQSDYHHIKNVMRMKKDDYIKVVFDGVIYTCKITNLKDDVTFDIIEKETKNTNDFKVDVAFSLIKEQKMDYLLQKSTEVGVNKLIPIETKRCVVKIEGKKVNSKKERWNKIIKEASEQSFRCNVPEIYDILTLKELVKKEYDLKLLCSLNKNTKNIKKVLQKNNKCDRILLVVGPEGGFETLEEEFLTQNGFISITLGDTVLRAETAPVVALSIINYELGR
jgi:16S rRNA (uracil1498-N3)-methyltransferase